MVIHQTGNNEKPHSCVAGMGCIASTADTSEANDDEKLSTKPVDEDVDKYLKLCSDEVYF